MLFARVLIFLLLLSVIQACNDGRWYEKSLDIPASVWSYQDTLTYELSVEDTSGINTLDLSVVYDENKFGYQNLYVLIKTTFPDQLETNQIVSLEILSDEAQLLKKCSDGKCKVNILLLDDFKFKIPGKYKISIVQYSREQKLEGIHNVGLTVSVKD